MTPGLMCLLLLATNLQDKTRYVMQGMCVKMTFLSTRARQIGQKCVRVVAYKWPVSLMQEEQFSVTARKMCIQVW